jgi:hypothetical protein
MMLYAQDHDEKYAPTYYPSADQKGHWANLMIPYLGGLSFCTRGSGRGVS